jgi:NADH-quinone oxidoreductase subunit J
VTATFYAAAAVALLATVLAITQKNVVHGLLYLIVSLLAVALMFYALGAPFVAALEVIVYAGAIMVLFVFVMMLLNLGPATVEQERRWQPGRMWIGPVILSGLLLAELLHGIGPSANQAIGAPVIDPHAVGVSLFTRYALGVEIASMLLLSGLIGAYHVGRRTDDRREVNP